MKCLNWKVIGGLGVVALGVWALAPDLIGAALPLLLFAACPLAMLFMMRGMRNMQGDQCARPGQQADPAGRVADLDDQPLPELKARLSVVHAEQQALAREISRREAGSSTAPPRMEAAAAVGDGQEERTGGGDIA